MGETDCGETGSCSDGRGHVHFSSVSVLSDSMRPHRWQTARLPCPWNSPGKNTGVCCHFLLQCMEVKSESEVPQLCPTPSDPMDCSPPGSSIHGTFHARVLEWVAISFSSGRDWLRGKLGLVMMGGALLSKSLIQFSVDGQSCVPSL